MPDWRANAPHGESWQFSRAINLESAKALGYVTPFYEPQTYATEESIVGISTYRTIHDGKEDKNSMLSIAVTTGLDNLVCAYTRTNGVFANQY